MGQKKRVFSFLKYKKTKGLLENLIIKINSAMENTYLSQRASKNTSE
jgi:hypothetical protein